MDRLIFFVALFDLYKISKSKSKHQESFDGGNRVERETAETQAAVMKDVHRRCCWADEGEDLCVLLRRPDGYLAEQRTVGHMMPAHGEHPESYETRIMIPHLHQVYGLGKTEDCYESCHGGKWELETRVVGRKRALLASTTLVSGEQIGGRRAKEAKCMISHMIQVGGLGETENCLKGHPGGKWEQRT